MPAPPYHDSVTSISVFKQRFKSEYGRSFPQISYDPASKWERQHLLACRVICRPTQNFVLPLLSQHANRLGNEDAIPYKIKDLLKGPKDVDMRLSEHQLVRIYGVSLGQVWAALRVIKYDSKPTNDEPQPTVPATPRHRQPVTREGFVDPTTMVVGSSPLRGDGDGSKPSSKSSSIGYMEMASKKSDPSEDQTIRLVNCFVRHVLYYCHPQENDKLFSVVEFRDEKARFDVTTPGRTVLRATDDGGLLLGKLEENTFKVLDKGISLLEAKSRFQIVEDGEPLLSDECLAQMTCEALAFRLASGNSNPDVIVICAIQHYIRFLHFEVTDEYLADFDSDAPTSFLYVTSTPWLDLDDKGGRWTAVRNLSGIAARALEP